MERNSARLAGGVGPHERRLPAGGKTDIQGRSGLGGGEPSRNPAAYDLAGFGTFGFKGLGAALSLLVGSIYYFFILRYMAWKTSKILLVSQSFKLILSAVVMIGVMYLVDWLFIPAIDWIALVVLAVVAVFSYGATAYLIGELDASDYRYFRSMLNPQGTLEYEVHEILGKRGH